MMTKKLKLKDIKAKSFVTDEKAGVKGGFFTTDPAGPCTDYRVGNCC